MAQREAETKIRIALIEVEAERQIAVMKAGMAMAGQEADLQSEEMRMQAGQVHEMGLADAERDAERSERERDREHETAMVPMHGLGAVEET